MSDRPFTLEETNAWIGEMLDRADREEWSDPFPGSRYEVVVHLADGRQFTMLDDFGSPEWAVVYVYSHKHLFPPDTRVSFIARRPGEEPVTIH